VIGDIDLQIVSISELFLKFEIELVDNVNNGHSYNNGFTLNIRGAYRWAQNNNS